MRKLTAAAAVLVMMMLTALPVYAEHGNDDYIDDDNQHNVADEWSNSGIESFCTDPAWANNYSGSALSNIITDISLALSEWPNNTDFNRVFDHTGECPGQASFMDAWNDASNTRAALLGESTQEEFCQNYLTGSASRVEYENISGTFPNSYGFTIVCDRDENNFNDFFVLIMDPSADWYFPQNAPNSNFPESFLAMLTHEAGHVLGWSGHFPNTAGTCDNDSTHNTMCQDGYGYVHGLGGWANASIESHDIGEVNQNY